MQRGVEIESKGSEGNLCTDYCSVAKSCLILGDPMDCSTPGFTVVHHVPEFAQTHVHLVGDAIQPSCPLSSPSPPTLSLSQHHRVFSNESAFRLRWPKNWSFSFSISLSNGYSGLISFRTDWLQSKGLSGVFLSTTVWKHQFFGKQPSLGPTLMSVRDYWKNYSFD